MKRLRALPILLVFVALAACNLPKARPNAPVALSLNAAGPQTWIDAPLDEMHLPLAPYEVVFHGTDDAGVTSVELRINDKLVTVPSVEGTSTRLVTARYPWVPDAPGKYVLQARSLGSGGTWSQDAVVTVWIGDNLTPSFTPTPTFTPTPVITITPTVVTPPPAGGPLSIEFLGASDSEFFYGTASCGPTTISLWAQVSDPAQIMGVTLFYKLRDKDTGQYTEWDSDLDLKPQGNGRFAINLDSRSVNGMRSGAYWFIYQFIGTGSNHQPNARTQVYGDISLSQCGSEPWIIIPLDPHAPWIVLDPTPAPPIVK